MEHPPAVLPRTMPSRGRLSRSRTAVAASFAAVAALVLAAPALAVKTTAYPAPPNRWPTEIAVGADGGIWTGLFPHPQDVLGTPGAGLAVTDPATGATRRVDVPTTPLTEYVARDLARGPDRGLWSLFGPDRINGIMNPTFLFRVDPITRRVVNRHRFAGDSVPTMLAAGRSTLWVVGQNPQPLESTPPIAFLERIDPASGAVAASYRFDGLRVLGAAVAPDGRLWVRAVHGNVADPVVGVFNPADGTLRDVVPSQSAAISRFFPARAPIVVDGSTVWWVDRTGRVNALDSVSEAVRLGPRLLSGPATLDLLSVGPDHAVWVGGGPFVARIDPTTMSVRAFSTLPYSAFELAVQPNGMVWFAQFDARRIVRVNPFGTRPSPVQVSHALIGGFGAVAVCPAGCVARSVAVLTDRRTGRRTILGSQSIRVGASGLRSLTLAVRPAARAAVSARRGPVTVTLQRRFADGRVLTTRRAYLLVPNRP